jgi:hypothetical protein
VRAATTDKPRPLTCIGGLRHQRIKPRQRTPVTDCVVGDRQPPLTSDWSRVVTATSHCWRRLAVSHQSHPPSSSASSRTTPPQTLFITVTKTSPRSRSTCSCHFINTNERCLKKGLPRSSKGLTSQLSVVLCIRRLFGDSHSATWPTVKTLLTVDTGVPVSHKLW